MSRLTRLLGNAPPPAVAVEIAADHVAAAAIASRPDGAVVTAHGVEPLPEGLIVPSLTDPNVRDAAVLSAALQRVIERVGHPRRVGLVVPDPVAKVSMLRFEQAPVDAEDLDRLIRWQIRKAVPFAIDDAQVGWSLGAPGQDGRQFVVAAARRSVVEEYERACVGAGAEAGVVDLSTFNLANAVLSGEPPTSDWLLVHLAAAYVSIAILRGQHLVFFRTRGDEADEVLDDIVHQTVMYYEDRLQGSGFERVVLSAGSASGTRRLEADRVRKSLEARTAATVETIAGRGAAALSDRIDASPLLDTLAPLVGLLLRGREAA